MALEDLFGVVTLLHQPLCVFELSARHPVGGSWYLENKNKKRRYLSDIKAIFSYYIGDDILSGLALLHIEREFGY